MANCLLPDCKRKITTRGLCKTHYISAWRFIHEGKTTWKQLEKEKKVLPSVYGKVQDYFLEGAG